MPTPATTEEHIIALAQSCEEFLAMGATLRASGTEYGQRAAEEADRAAAGAACAAERIARIRSGGKRLRRRAA